MMITRWPRLLRGVPYTRHCGQNLILVLLLNVHASVETYHF